MPPPTAFKTLHVLDVNYTYLDRGPPASSNYATWVFIHGMAFNGAILEKLLPLAHTHNLRITRLPTLEWISRRGAGAQKKFDEAEPFFPAQGTEIATFLVRFATEQCIPMADPKNLGVGGIALIGWSLGAMHVLTLLAYLDELPKDTLSTLQKYLHTTLSHDASVMVLGIPNTPKDDDSLWLEDDDRKRFDFFFDWVTAHFIHKSVTSENIDDLEFNNPSEEIPRSLCNLSGAQRVEYTSFDAFLDTGCDGKLLLCDPTAFAGLTKRALFDKRRAAKSPNIRVRYMSGGSSAGVFTWSLWMLRRYAENPPEELYGGNAEKARDIKVIAQTEGNHFVFWEDPEKAIQQYSVTINL